MPSFSLRLVSVGVCIAGLQACSAAQTPASPASAASPTSSTSTANSTSPTTATGGSAPQVISAPTGSTTTAAPVATASVETAWCTAASADPSGAERKIGTSICGDVHERKGDPSTLPTRSLTMLTLVLAPHRCKPSKRLPIAAVRSARSSAPASRWG